jgi:hypothetical protein
LSLEDNTTLVKGMFMSCIFLSRIYDL